MKFRVGDTVKIKNGTIDPDFGDNIGGWQGQVSEIDDDVVCIDLDSTTLSNCPEKYIQQCEEDGLNWQQIYLSVEDIEKASPRDSTANLIATKEALKRKHQWDYLGESGRRIYAVLKDSDLTDEYDQLKIWEKYLARKLSFPFDAEILEYQENGPLQEGNRVKMHALMGIDDHYGIIVKLRSGRRVYHYPLCIIGVKNKKTQNYQMINDYSVWFANR